MINKRGLSDVVTTVLIILFAIVAVTIVGGVVINQINKAGSKVESLTTCNALELEPVKCIYNEQTTSPAVGLLYRRGAGGGELQLVQVDLLVERTDKTIVNRTYIDALHIPTSMQTIWGSLANYITTGAITASNPPSKFRIAASFKDSKGKITKCSPSSTEVSCVKGGGNVPYVSISPAATVTVSLSSGVASQVLNLVTYQSGYKENSIATLVQTSGGGSATVFISTVKETSPSSIQMSILDSNSGWGVTTPTSAFIK